MKQLGNRKILHLIKKYSVVVVALIIFTVYFYPYFLGYVDLHSGMIYTDLWLFNFPLKAFYQEMLTKGQLPFWTSLIGNGYPLFAEGQMGALYPPNLILFRLLPLVTAFNLNTVLHFFLAFVFTYVFARKSLELSRRASFLSAFLYPFSGYYINHTFQINIDIVISYLPLTLFLVDRMSKGKLKYVLFLSICFAFEILAGHIEMFYYGTIATFSFMLLSLLFAGEKPKKIALAILGFVVAGILAAGISSAQLLPTYELTKYSSRSQGVQASQAEDSRWPIPSLLLFFNPRYLQVFSLNENYNGLTQQDAAIMDVYLYIGFLPILLALYSIATNRKRKSVIFSMILLVAFVYAFGNYTQFFTLLWNTLPGLKFFRYPTKIAFLITFSLCILAGLGYEKFFERLMTRKKNVRRIYFMSLAVILISIIDVSIFNVYGMRKLVNAKWWLEKPQMAMALESLLGDPYNQRVYDHGTNNLDYNYARNPVMQKSFQNILMRDFNMIYHIPDNREWVVLFVETQVGLSQPNTVFQEDDKSIYLTYSLEKTLALQAVKYLISDVPVSVKGDNLKEIKTIPLSVPVDHSFYVRNETGGTYTVQVPVNAIHLYETSFSYPRSYFISGKVKVITDDKESLGYILGPDFDPEKEIVFNQDYGFSERRGETGVQIPALVTSDEQNTLKIEGEAPTSGFVVLADTFFPGWKAVVNGKETEILKANFGQRAVAVEKGNFEITMDYEPTYWNLGKTITLTSSFLVLFVLTFLGVKHLVRSRKK